MKKVLAWAVALALVLSSFTMAFAADAPNSSQFKDASSINYTEAVDVMVATGIINGYPDGTFGPAKTVKRAEMAKMIAVMMNGGEDVGDQYKSACPFADSKDHWAAGYIAYCSAEHIIDGRSADVFDPEAEVTGTEVAKMALTSLGYDSKIQGYVGENWAAAVLKDAKKVGLFDGLDKSFVPGDPCSREAAAQILFNCLQGTEVEYKNGTSVSVGDDVSVVVDSEIQDVATGRNDYDNPPKDNKLQLFEDVFGGKLVKTEGKDAEGNPAHTWTYPDKKTEVGTYADTADYEFVVEDATSVEKAIEAYDKDLAKDLYAKENNTPVYAFSYAVNGAEPVTTAPANLYLGDKVKLYVEEKESGNTVLVTIMQYQPYLITKVDTNVKKTDADNDVTAYVYLTQAGGDGTRTLDTELKGYDASTYVADTVIAVAKNGSTIVDSYVLEEAASGNVEKATSDAITVGGTKYDLTKAFKNVDGNPYTPLKDDNEFTFYDYNGYVIASVQTAEAESDVFYGVLTEIGEDSATFGGSTKYAKIITADGEKVIAISSKCKEFASAAAEEGTTYNPTKTTEPVKQLISYTLNDDEELASITHADAATGDLASADGATMKTEGVLAGKTVSADVAAFWLDPTDEDAEWVVYGFDDLNNEDVAVKATDVIMDEDEIVALLLNADLVDDSTEAILGFVTAVEPFSTSDGDFYTVTALVDGKEVTYTTAKEVTLGEFNANTLYEFTLNADGDLKVAPTAANVLTDNVTAPVKEFGKNGDIEYVAAGILNQKVAAKQNNSVNIGSAENKDFQNIASAAVYYLNDEGNLEVSSYDYININDNPYVWLYQTNESKQVWNIVVFKDDSSKAAAVINSPTN